MAEEVEEIIFDCIVVGAGIEGSCTARYAASVGKKTLCLEQFPLPHDRGSSHGQSRVARHSYPDYYYAVLIPEAFVQWAEIERLAKEKLFVHCGYLTIDGPPYSTINAISENFKAVGISGESVSAQQLRKKYMLNYPDNFMGLLEKNGGVLLANKCLRAVQQQLVAFGGTLQDNEKVLEIIPGDIVEVKTNKGKYKTRTVILTPGPWATSLLKPLGIDVILQPRRITSYYWKVKQNGFKAEENNYPTWCHFTKFNETTFKELSGLFYALPCLEYPDMIKICGHVPVDIDPDARDEVENSLGTEQRLSEYIKDHVIGVDWTKPCIIEHCIETATTDSNCILDRHPKFKNIVMGVGFSGSGFKKAPVIGKILFQLAFGLQPSYNLKPFKVDRFKKIPKSSL